MAELAQAWRRFRRRPARPLTAILTLTLGIAASTAAFSAVHDVLLRPLPVRAQDRLVVAWTRDPARSGFDHVPVGMNALHDLQNAGGTLAEVAATWSTGPRETLVSGLSGTVVARHVGVSGDFFAVLGARAALGRLLDSDDDVAGAAPVAVISHAWWVQHEGADPRVVGTVLHDGGRDFTVVGVAPAGFDLPRGADVWVTLHGIWPHLDDTPRAPSVVELDLWARLSPRATVTDAAEHMRSVLSRDPALAGSYRHLVPLVVSLPEHIFGSLRQVLLGTLAAAIALLMASVADTTLLLLSEGTRSARDMAVRRALGAGRAQAARSVVADAALVAVSGVVGGTLLAWLAVRRLVPLVPSELPRLGDVHLDSAAVAFAVAVSLVSLGVSGSLASLALSRGDPQDVLRGGGRGGTTGQHPLRSTLAGLQIALAFVSAVGSGLLLRSVHHLGTIEPGFDPDGLQIVQLDQPWPIMKVPASYVTNLRTVVERLEATPGIVAASPTLDAPSNGSGGGLEMPLQGEGQTDADASHNPWASIDAVLPGYFRAVGIHVVRGRGITDADREDALHVVVLSQSAARGMWPGQNPLGKRILGYPGQMDAWFTVVGVVDDTHYRSLVADRPAAYFSLAQAREVPPTRLLVRTGAGGPTHLRQAVARAFAAAEPDVQVLGVQRVRDLLDRPLERPRLAASVMAAFAAATVVVGMLGVYGVFTALVDDRRRDLGVRRALGARASHLAGWVARQVGVVAVVGVVAGAAVAIAAGGVMSALLYGVSAIDAATFITVGVATLAVVAGAAVRPMVRAARADPMESLREE